MGWLNRHAKAITQRVGPAVNSSAADESAKVDVGVSVLPGDVSIGTENSLSGSMEKVIVRGDIESSSGHSSNEHDFQNPEKAKFWMEEYEKANYESRHLIDPEMSWTPQEERRVVLKSDFHACLWAFVMFLALDIDRYNLSNAVSDNLLDDLGLSTNDYNLGVTLNLVCFLVAELPSQLVSKAVGADWFLPTQVTLWSIVAICQCAMKNKAGFLITRCLVGFFEGGFLPEQITWLSYFYTHEEFVTRSAWFYVANPLTQAFSGLLAAAIQTLDGRGGWPGWRYVFLIEGIITLFLGLCSFKMPAGPANTRKWYRRKGWYTDREEKIMANRIVRDDPSKGTMSNRTGISVKMLGRALSDYDMWPLYITRFLTDIIAQPLSQYISLILRGMGFGSVHTNLLMVPYCVLQIITMLSQSYLATLFKNNGYALFFTPFWLLFPVVCMRYWPGFLNDHWGSYALMFVALGYPPSWPISISWSSGNSYSVARRTVSAAIMNMFSQAGALVGSNIFRASDKPRYAHGLEALIGISSVACVAVLFTRFYYVWRNRQRDKKWSVLTIEEQINYIKTTRDEGNKRLDFRFVL